MELYNNGQKIAEVHLDESGTAVFDPKISGNVGALYSHMGVYYKGEQRFPKDGENFLGGLYTEYNTKTFCSAKLQDDDWVWTDVLRNLDLPDKKNPFVDKLKNKDTNK